MVVVGGGGWGLGDLPGDYVVWDGSEESGRLEEERRRGREGGEAEGMAEDEQYPQATEQGGASRLLEALERADFYDAGNDGEGGGGGEGEGDSSSQPQPPQQSSPTITSLLKSHSWPSHLLGLPLGSIIARIRSGDLNAKNDPRQREILNAVGFDWGDEDRFMRAPFERTLKALYAFTKIRGDLCMEYDFVVPSYEPWPREVGGLELGKYVNFMRSQKALYEEHYPDKLEVLNMQDFQVRERTATFTKLLTIFKKLNQNPRQFIQIQFNSMQILDYSLDKWQWLPPQFSVRKVGKEERKGWFGSYGGDVDVDLKSIMDQIQANQEAQRNIF